MVNKLGAVKMDFGIGKVMGLRGSTKTGSGHRLIYRVTGTNDGCRDDFNIPLAQLQDVRVRVPIRNNQAFYVTVSGQVFNFFPWGMTSGQAVFAIQQKVGTR